MSEFDGRARKKLEARGVLLPVPRPSAFTLAVQAARDAEAARQRLADARELLGILEHEYAEARLEADRLCEEIDRQRG